MLKGVVQKNTEYVLPEEDIPSLGAIEQHTLSGVSISKVSFSSYYGFRLASGYYFKMHIFVYFNKQFSVKNSNF